MELKQTATMEEYIATFEDLQYQLMWQPAQENTVLSPKPIHFGH
jgi:hypothetical protein